MKSFAAFSSLLVPYLCSLCTENVQWLALNKLSMSHPTNDVLPLQGPRRGGGGGAGRAIALPLLFLGFILKDSSWHGKNSLGIIRPCSLEEWDVCLSERLQPDVPARIIGCNAQMEWIGFFFPLHLGEHLYSHTDNLSKDLQGTKMAAVSEQRLANLTKETLTKIRTDQSFDHSHAKVARKSEGLLSEPTLPRKRHTPARLEVAAGAPSYLQTAKDHFRRVYYEAIDLVVDAIYQRVNEESFSS